MTRPRDLRAGFHADVDDAISGLHHAGEQWAAPRYLITPHKHPVWEFYLQVHGMTSWRAGQTQTAARPGEFFGVPAGITHHMAEPSRGNHHFYFAAIDISAALSRHSALAAAWPAHGRLIHRTGGQPLFDAFDQLIREVTGTAEFATVGLSITVDLLMLQISRLLLPTSLTPMLKLHPAVTRVRATLERDYAHNWTLAELAQSVGLARTYLSALFTAEVGCSPHVYLLQRRIQRAEQLLRTSDLSITAIAGEIGFSSSQHFARVFRQHTGQAPRDFRARVHRQDQPARH